MKIDRETMIRLLRGELEADEAGRVRSAIDADRQMKAEFGRVRRLEGVLNSSAAESFGPYFRDRVMRRILDTGSEIRSSFYESLRWVFLRLAVACLLVVVGLGVYNAVDAESSGLTSSAVEAVFGIPSADIDNLYYLQGI